MDEFTGFRDIDHVREWLLQFRQSAVRTDPGYASVQMLAILANALALVLAEVDKLRSDAEGSAAEGM